MNIQQKIKALRQYKSLFADNLMGIEKEGLRVSKNGYISQSSHPNTFGCALTHPNITTDFSEALIEIVTPPTNSASKTLNFLENTQHYLYHHLPQEQTFWTASMPCIINGEKYIPIAQYGSSNTGKMKTIYRKGLANRYGSVMQTIAGIHFNYSFSAYFWQIYQNLINTNTKKQCFIDNSYMGLTRNAIRYGWLIPYLFGASACVCKSFLKDYHKHNLIEFNDNTLYLPYATSLRMGDIGYQNFQEDKVGVKANYNSLCHYVSSLKAAMQTNCEAYVKIGLKKDGEYQQLNTNILQIENEYYASIRPKPLANKNKKPLDMLTSSGINYIELRSIDINPLLPLGIDKQQIYFLEAFLLFCLLENSEAIATYEQLEIDNNNITVAHYGRKPGLRLTHKGQNITLQSWGLELILKIELCAQLLSTSHQKAVKNIIKCINDPNLTISAIILNAMQNNNQGHFDYIDCISKQYRKSFLNKKINQKHFTYLNKQAQNSCKKQQVLENTNDISFEQFLANYFT